MKIESGYNGSVFTYKGITPKIHKSVFLAEGVRIIGDVEVGKNSSVWYNSVVRGDVHYIKIGEGTNIQDLSMLHVTNNKYALNIGNYVTIGHSVTLHGCTIKDRCLVGIGAIVLDNAKVNSSSLVAAGALVREGFEVPEGTLVAGVPAKIIRDLNEDELNWVRTNSENYINYVKEYRKQIK